ncbi:MAG: histidine--tRNA ligase [Candidatus Omnitrophota bacterium]
MFNRIPGTKDILPDEIGRWQQIEEAARRVFALYNYSEVRFPLIEDIALFNRSLGESAEIVQKQMFVIKNASDTYALRPEGTAPIARAYLENNLDKNKGLVKLYYTGPMFRLERPQKGRLRQFHHLGCEVIGSSNPMVDVEVVSLADTLLKAFGVAGYVIEVNSLGCAEDKNGFIHFLRDSLKPRLADLCPECNERFGRNALRILDCKNPSCRETVSGLLESGDSFLCSGCLRHAKEVRGGLDSLGIKYRINPCLVRGLDYYTGTVFEIKHAGLGAQDAIGAGGRYDDLIRELGGPATGAMGFAFGMERLLLVSCQDQPERGQDSLIYLITLGDAAGKEGLRLLSALRGAGIPSDTDYENKSLKGAMRKANDAGASRVLILGEDELKKQVIAFRDMRTSQQREVPLKDLIEELRKDRG